MLNLFGPTKTKTQTTKDSVSESTEQYSRFTSGDNDNTALQQLGKLTRFEAQQRQKSENTLPAVTHVTPKRPKRLVPGLETDRRQDTPLLGPTINENAHLHEDSHIPLWVIRKALPDRFSKPYAEDTDLAFQ